MSHLPLSSIFCFCWRAMWILPFQPLIQRSEDFSKKRRFRLSRFQFAAASECACIRSCCRREKASDWVAYSARGGVLWNDSDLLFHILILYSCRAVTNIQDHCDTFFVVRSYSYMYTFCADTNVVGMNPRKRLRTPCWMASLSHKFIRCSM